MEMFEKLSRAEMKNVKGGKVGGGPGDCVDGCSDTNRCPDTSPYCLSTSCINKDGVKVNITGCSPTLP